MIRFLVSSGGAMNVETAMTRVFRAANLKCLVFLGRPHDGRRRGQQDGTDERTYDIHYFTPL